MIRRDAHLCPLCGGEKKKGMTTFTVDLKETIVVVRDVPVTICSLCGNEWIADDVAEVLETIVQDARTRKHIVEVTTYRKVA
jgi:YgiT-type zinc finger domain-containing protein